MKLLIAATVMRCKEAGAAGVVFRYAEEFQKLGHEVDSWFFDDLLPSPRWPARFRDLEFCFAVSQRIRRNPTKYDVVNLHAPCGALYGLSRKFFRSKTLPPYVFTMQGSEERYVYAMRLEAKKGRAQHFSWKNRVWHRLYHQTMYDFSISTADFGTVVNREGWILSELKYGHPPGRMRYIPNGVGSEYFYSRTFADMSAPRLLYVGTWLDRKGIFYLVESFADLALRLPGLSLTIAGCMVPENEIKAHFPEAVRSRVHVLPFLGREAMPDLYNTHDVFVFPSLVEGMPLTLLEAMASAMPIVTTSSSGMADLIEADLNGILIPPADTEQLTSAIERFCASRELRQNLGLAAQASARKYTWERAVRQLEQVLQLAVRSHEGDH